jgi:hypothetical protein
MGVGMITNASPNPKEASQREVTADEWRGKAESLWQMLDDISTYFDMFKPDMEPFERRVWKRCEERHNELTSDGYKLYPVD